MFKYVIDIPGYSNNMETSTAETVLYFASVICC